MRTILCLLLTCGFSFYVQGQPTCDIATGGISSIPNSIAVGQTTDLRFDVFNDAQGGSCCYEVSSVLVLVSLPSTGLAYQSIISPSGGTGAFFNWVYDAPSKTVQGINHTQICDGQGEVNVTIRAIGHTLASYPANRTVVLTITQNPEGPPFLSNNEGNDNGTTIITITTPLPIELASFTAESGDCNQVQLIWETASEINNDFMEIQRSEDGRDFTSVGKVKGTNKPEGDRYSFTDNNNLIEGKTYFYRLIQVDFDGRSEIFNSVSVRNDCPESVRTLSLYPNPAFDKVNVALGGFEDQETVNLVITNAIGELVLTVPAASTSEANEIKIQTLPAGVYSVRIEGNDKVGSKRFIKIH